MAQPPKAVFLCSSGTESGKEAPDIGRFSLLDLEILKGTDEQTL